MKSPFLLLVLLGCIAHFEVPAIGQDKPTSQPPTAAQTVNKSAGDVNSLRTLSGEVVYTNTKGLKPPHLIKSADPEYPNSARSHEGKVGLQLIVNSQGLPEQIRVQKPLGHGLDESAVAAVSKWKFAPATKDGVPVAVVINVEVQFGLP